MRTPIDYTTFARVTSDRASFIKQIVRKIDISNRSATILGDPIERDGMTVIPVAKARWHSVGSSTQPEAAMQGGAGTATWATVSPTGYVIIKDGKPRYQPIFNASTILLWLLGSGIIAMLVIKAVRRLRHS